MMSWGNEEDRNYERRRKHRNRFGADEDVFGEADAEDRSDDGSMEDLSFEGHAAGLDRDLGYERSYSDRQEDPQGYNENERWRSSAPPPQGQYQQGQYQQGQYQQGPYQQSGPPPSNQPPGQLPSRAQNLQNRIQRRSQRAYERQSGQDQGAGIDGLFDANLNLSKFIPCSNSVLFLLVIMIAGLGCAAMAVLAFSSLTRNLGF